MVGGEHELQMVWGFLLFIFGFWKPVCPQNAVEDKRENYICAEVGEEERMCCSAAMWSAVFHIPKALPGISLSKDQHLSSEWFPDLIPEDSAPQAGKVSQAGEHRAVSYLRFHPLWNECCFTPTLFSVKSCAVLGCV